MRFSACRSMTGRVTSILNFRPDTSLLLSRRVMHQRDWAELSRAEWDSEP